jgi:signal peptide peptidase SppA
MDFSFSDLGVKLMAIHEGYLHEHFLAITQPRENKPFSAEEFHQKHEAALQIGYDYDNSVYYIKTNPNIALIPVIGATSKFGGWSSMGTQYLSRMLNAAKNSDKYKAVLLYIDSPGGEVDGMKDWSEEILATDMPTLAFIDGYGASGGYWQAISADRVLANSLNQNTIGSVGVQTVHIDRREVAKTTIGEVRILRAKQSSMKNLANPFEELKPEAEAWIIDRLTESASVFISHVSSRRPGIDAKSDALKGQVYTGQQAVDEGMIDGLATYEEAIAELVTMIPGTTTNSKSTTNSKTNASMKFNISMTAILSALGFGAVASEEEAPLVTQERLTALNAGLESANGKITAHEATITQLKADLKTAQDSLATAEADRDKYKADAEKYGKQAGAAHTPPKKDKAEGGNTEPTAEEQAAAEIAALPHNAALDSNPLFN